MSDTSDRVASCWKALFPAAQPGNSSQSLASRRIRQANEMVTFKLFLRTVALAFPVDEIYSVLVASEKSKDLI